MCQYVSAYFRTVQYELDKVSDVTTPVFDHYNTGALPSGGPSRNLSVMSAYAEAGIEVQATGGSDVIPIDEAELDRNDKTFDKWDNSELHHRSACPPLCAGPRYLAQCEPPRSWRIACKVLHSTTPPSSHRFPPGFKAD